MAGPSATEMEDTTKRLRRGCDNSVSFCDVDRVCLCLVCSYVIVILLALFLTAVSLVSAFQKRLLTHGVTLVWLFALSSVDYCW